MIGKYIRFEEPRKGYTVNNEYGGIVLDKVKRLVRDGSHAAAVDFYVVEVTEQQEGYDEWEDLSTPIIKLADPKMVIRIIHSDDEKVIVPKSIIA